MAKSIYKDEFVFQARQLAELGATDKQLGVFFGVSEVSINNWKKDHPAFKKALDEGKVIPNKVVENSLYNRAAGNCKIIERRVVNDPIKGKITTVIEKEVLPDVVAGIFWLKNRNPERWKDKPVADGDMDSDLAQALANIIMAMKD